MNTFHSHIHRFITLNNRINVLSREISNLIEENSSVLDVGCGSGEISANILKKKQLKLKGIDILVRPDAAIQVEEYDGINFPYPDNSFDYVIFIDVLHHTPKPEILIKEAARVAKHYVIIKDHNCNNWFQKRILSFTDWFGNAQFGVNLEFNFLSKKKWLNIFQNNGLIVKKNINPKIYPSFTRILFWKEIDFIAKLKTKQ
jgi:ubiquinone/menaquinone biosynthesis C-methylase UbiE